MPRLARRPRHLAAVVLATALHACGSDPVTPDPTPPIVRWAGSYTGQARFGAANGTWGNGGTYPLVVSMSGQVTVSGTPLIDAVYDDASATLSWTISAGNATNGEAVFHESLTSDYFFRDLANATAGQGLTGFIQRPGDGRLDYRGVLR